MTWWAWRTRSPRCGGACAEGYRYVETDVARHIGRCVVVLHHDGKLDPDRRTARRVVSARCRGFGGLSMWRGVGGREPLARCGRGGWRNSPDVLLNIDVLVGRRRCEPVLGDVAGGCAAFGRVCPGRSVLGRPGLAGGCGPGGWAGMCDVRSGPRSCWGCCWAAGCRDCRCWVGWRRCRSGMDGLKVVDTGISGVGAAGLGP